jgi:enoyl-CoA hydratase
MSTERILLERGDDGITVLTINRPERRNALDLVTVQAFHHTLDELDGDSALRVLIVTGAGDKAFVAGADIAELKERTHLEALQGINSSLFRRLEEFPAPTIAAVRGYALGGGCELALCCDLRVAGTSAVFGQPEVALGIIPAAGGLYRLPRVVGMGRAKELVFTGRRVDASEAERIGLVNRVVPDAEVLAAAKALAREIAKNGALAVRMAKSVMQAVARPLADPTGAIENLAQAVLFDSPDKHARMAAHLAKQKPKNTKENQ